MKQNRLRHQAHVDCLVARYTKHFCKHKYKWYQPRFSDSLAEAVFKHRLKQSKTEDEEKQVLEDMLDYYEMPIFGIMLPR